MLEFELDSILTNLDYKPKRVCSRNTAFTLAEYDFINDSVALGQAALVINHYTARPVMARLNIFQNEIEQFGYVCPRLSGEKKVQAAFEASIKDSLYVNCYRDFDLLTLCDLNGQLVCNIYGPGWKEKDEKWNAYYSDVY
ncbi:hypothetical protein DMA11_25325, partial [Marinilabiliaceae bacterium JC017]